MLFRSARAKPGEDAGDVMDVDETASVAGSARGRARPPKSKAQGTPGSAKRRVRVAEARVVPGTDGEDDDAHSVKSAPVVATKRRGRPPKSKATITDSDREMDVDEGKGKEKKAAEKKAVVKPRPRSLSRTRLGDASDPSHTKPKSRAKKAREANAKETEADGAEGDDEKPKKRRKVINS